MKAKKWKLAECARRGCASPPRVRHARGSTQQGASDECAKLGEKETKKRRAMRETRGSSKKSPRVFVFPFVRSKNKNISRRKSRQFEIKDLSLRSIKHNLSPFPSLCGVHIASNSVDYCPVDQRKCSLT